MQTSDASDEDRDAGGGHCDNSEFQLQGAPPPSLQKSNKDPTSQSRGERVRVCEDYRGLSGHR